MPDSTREQGTTTDSLCGEELLSLREAAAHLPCVSGKRPSASTLWRWCRRGLYGVRLEHTRIGRNMATSREALGRFLEALATARKRSVERA
jgi:hypothetical protein